ncbi:hypothetical protein Tco_0624841 [Tanacetum coccineum]|uniref:Uncharacterized protein n=1 Tax=Tanacetum coccineum TaxID=301880 RepID=A0ABQ4WF84_9ASTR
MSSSPHSTITSSEFNMENAFSTINIHNYTSASSTTSGSTSFNSSEDSRDGMIPPTFLLFYNNLYLKNVQASLIPLQDPITPPVILTPSPVLPPLLLFDPQDLFVLEKLLPSKKQIHPPSSSSTTLSNSSRKQAYSLEPRSFSVYTPTPPQIFKIRKSSIKEHLKHHEKQIKDILYYLEELSFHYIEKIEERLYGLPKGQSTSEASVMTHDAIRKLVVDSVATALEAQANNPNSGPRKILLYKERHLRERGRKLLQPFYFNGTEGAVGLIRWFKQSKSVFSCSNYAEKNKNSKESLTGFAAALAVLVTGASQSRQHESHHRFFPVDTSLIHIESRKSPTKSLFDVGSRRISIFTVNTKEYHSDVLAILTR